MLLHGFSAPFSFTRSTQCTTLFLARSISKKKHTHARATTQIKKSVQREKGGRGQKHSALHETRIILSCD